MFFRRAVSIEQTPSVAPATADEAIDIAPLLDAFGLVLSAFEQGGVDLPGRPASELISEMAPWRMHAVLGTPVDGGEHAAASDRDFQGAARAMARLRQTEKSLIESALSDLRECLWSCVQRVHVAVQADVEADTASAGQLARVQKAIHVLETGAVKDEVMQAIQSIERISHARREKQQASFAGLVERIDQLAVQLEEARRESETDPLTGLGNRKRLELAAERALQRHLIGGIPCTLVLMDLDGLKQINDTRGHPAGDAALLAFSSCMSKVFLRASDELCRIGGDEFVALLPSTGKELAARLTNRLLDTVNEWNSRNSESAATVSASIGFTELQAREDLQRWLARADTALYEAKSRGGGRAVAG